ncbi:uncharacterized protein N7483_005159 [Penicillium malachiteum]|uniref:uncharacterized protein n=1 Tax=Penicillium malachiteum TaxID=1324776 RepID=UPI0025472F02|nr:uncharacterized protein N7483_005159 [Penicillium malachiteum]KAJ5730651.1 hypothetical protein N7483_005159 [Penicillium malachiteum]
MAATESAPSRTGRLSTLLESLTSCLTSAASSLPSSHKDESSNVSIEPPKDGISLLDTKSEILLSYLQNLVFLIIFQLRQASSTKGSTESEEPAEDSLRDEVSRKLVELRVFLDRGVRPLEGRLKYQIDKVIKAAEEAERSERPAPSKKSKGEDESGSEEEDEDDMDEMAYRPNVAAFSKAKVEDQKSEVNAKRNNREAPSDGIYRPPKIMPTALPTLDKREREDRRPRRSNVIDEFVSAEMSSAPMAEPSIGSTIVAGGRETKSKKDREWEADRNRYEESNFVRLPKETKKEMAKRRGRDRQTYGGDEWKGLTEGADRIERLTRKGKSGGAALDKSRKRKNEDGQRGDGVGVGEIFDKRRKKVDSWKR